MTPLQRLAMDATTLLLYPGVSILVDRLTLTFAYIGFMVPLRVCWFQQPNELDGNLAVFSGLSHE